MAQKGGILSRQIKISRSVDIFENGAPCYGRNKVDMRAMERNIRLSGFTLVEVLMTIVILAILAAVAVPGFSAWLPNYRLKAAARDFVSNFQLAKMGAIKNNKTWAVLFYPGAPGKYYICSNDNGDGWNGPPTFGGNDVVEKEVSLDSYGKGIDYGHGDATTNATSGGGTFPGDHISFTANVATFSPKGTVPRRGYVYLSNKRGGSCAVGAPSIAGVIVLKKWTGSAWE